MIRNIFVFQLTVDGKSEGAILEGVEEDNEYQVSLSALYADGAQSEAVAIRYSTCEYTHTFTHVQGKPANFKALKHKDLVCLVC